MKTQNFLKSLSFLVLSSALSFVACKKNDSSNSSSATTPTYQLVNGVCQNQQGQVVATTLCTTNGYYMSNGYCYNPQGQMVTTTLCTTSTNGYYLSGGYCYSPQGQIVSNTFCTSSVGGLGQQCIGTFIYRTGYWTQMVYCNGADCRGYTLTEAATGRTVTCQ